jgi:hypothetical protein
MYLIILVMISLSKGESLKDFMIKETKSKLTQRYKLSHYAEDIGVSYCSIWRFTNGDRGGVREAHPAPKAVNEQFYLKWWKNRLDGQ